MLCVRRLGRDGPGDTAWIAAYAAVMLAASMIVTLGLAPGWRSALPIAAGQMAALAALMQLSIHRPGALRPPESDWFVPYLVLTLLAWAGAFAVRIRRADGEGRRTLLMIGGAALVVVLCVAGVAIGGRGHDAEDLQVDRQDLEPFPAVLQAERRSGDCGTGTGVCTDVIELWSPGRSPAEVASVLGGHLRGKGWPMAPSPDGEARYSGCLPIRGLFRWAEQACATTATSADVDWPDGVAHRDDSIVLIVSATPGDA